MKVATSWSLMLKLEAAMRSKAGITASLIRRSEQLIPTSHMNKCHVSRAHIKPRVWHRDTKILLYLGNIVL
jgi:hypothetical protein